jgi:hypothetical protein
MGHSVPLIQHLQDATLETTTNPKSGHDTHAMNPAIPRELDLSSQRGQTQCLLPSFISDLLLGLTTINIKFHRELQPFTIGESGFTDIQPMLCGNLLKLPLDIRMDGLGSVFLVIISKLT